MHAAQMHEYQTLVKQYAVDGRCPNCCRFYHHRLRLCAHFRTADDCLQRVRAAFPPLTDHELAPLNHADQDHTRDMRAQGEVLKPPDRCFVLLALLYLLMILRRLLQCWRNGNYAKGLLLLIVFEALWGFVTGLGLKCRRLVILRVTLTSSATFASHSMHGSEHGDHGCFSMYGLARLYARLYAQLHVKTLCFDHFYSGFRRRATCSTRSPTTSSKGIFIYFA